MNPYSQQDFSSDEISYFKIISKVLIQYTKRLIEIDELQSKLSHLQQNIRFINEQARQALEENKRLRGRLSVLEENRVNAEQDINHLSAPYSIKDRPRVFTSNDDEENLGLKNSFLDDETDLDQGDYQGELRLALEEIAYLKSVLLKNDQDSLEHDKPKSDDLSLNSEIIQSQKELFKEIRKSVLHFSKELDFFLDHKEQMEKPHLLSNVENLKVMADELDHLFEDQLGNQGKHGESE